MTDSHDFHLQRLDASLTAPFFSAAASALFEQGWISTLDVDSFRLRLKDYSRCLRENPQSTLLQSLREQSCVVLNTLSEVTGHTALQHILLRSVAAQLSVELISTLDSYARELVQKAELFFNQKFYLMEKDLCVSQSLFSFYLIEHAQTLFAQSQDLRKAVEDLRHLDSFSPLDSLHCRDFESKFATHLGFSSNKESTIKASPIYLVFRRLIFSMDLVREELLHFYSQLKHNIRSTAELEQIEIHLEQWGALLVRLSSLPIVKSSSHLQLEHYRLEIITSFRGVKNSIDAIQQLFHSALKTSQIKHDTSTPVIASDMRELFCFLLNKGLTFKDAKLAVEALRLYCQNHGIDPGQLLEAELTRFHPMMNSEAVTRLKARHLDSVQSPLINDEKAKVLRHKETILHALSSGTSLLLAFLVGLSSLLAGCGVKTAPRSDIVDLRPALPYHAKREASPASDLKNPPTSSTHEEPAK